MGVSHQQAVDKVFFFNARCRFAFTATTLCFVVGQRLILHIPLMRQGDHHIFWLIRSSMLISALLAVISVRRSSPN